MRSGITVFHPPSTGGKPTPLVPLGAREGRRRAAKPPTRNKYGTFTEVVRQDTTPPWIVARRRAAAKAARASRKANR